MKHCWSCAMPIDESKDSNYCEYCVDEKGNLRSKEESLHGISEWLKSWSPKLNKEKSIKRAENYMRSMPAWADKF